MADLHIDHPRAYLAGCLHGDAWLNNALCLKVADRDFAEAFQAAIQEGFSVSCPFGRCDRGYWLVKKWNGWGRFTGLKEHQPTGVGELGAWMRGFFDSEGNVYCKHLGDARGPYCYDRKVNMFSTEMATLTKAQGI